MWFVYVLQSKINDKFYIGCTNDIQRRLKEHNAGHTLSIKRFIPYELVYVEEHSNQTDAYAREKKIKSYKGGRAFKKLIKK